MHFSLELGEVIEYQLPSGLLELSLPGLPSGALAQEGAASSDSAPDGPQASGGRAELPKGRESSSVEAGGETVPPRVGRTARNGIPL